MINTYEKYKIKQVINASGKMTILGGSRVTSEILEAMNFGASNFFEIADLQDKVSQYLANLIKVEATLIVNSASGGIAQSVAACITGNDINAILSVPNVKTNRNEIIIPKGHNVDYGTSIEVPIHLGGGKIIEAGSANTCSIETIEQLITTNTAALLFVKSHHCVQKGMPDIEAFIDLGKRHNLPVIIDAAAESDIVLYDRLGADVVIYSGTKALNGPTSGLLIGKKQMIDLIKLQYKGIGRVMKVGKENIFGLVKALEIYMNNPIKTIAEQELQLIPFIEKVATISGVSPRIIQDSANRPILRAELKIATEILGKTASEIIKILQNEQTAIYTRGYRANEGIIEIDIRDVSEQELETIYVTIKKVSKNNKST
jgi:uncharacterized pyridoxal phosphate-dependent enzyme